MTKKADKNAPPTAQPFVYGQDAAGKPIGARFPATELARISPIATAMNLKLYEGDTEESVAIGMLPVGRLHANGKAFIPNIKRDLYDRIQAEVATSQKEAGVLRAAQVKGSPGAPESGIGTATAPTDVSAILPPLPSGLPQNWESIAVGNMVLADEGPGEGFWQAIVIARDNEILTLRYRDYPKVPKFERHISTIALINPRPA